MADPAVTVPTAGPTAPWHPAEVDGHWLRPVDLRAIDACPAEPRWGHPDGLQVALPPTPGPRGLLRIFTPYLGHPRDRLVNFVAVEPILRGATERGYSELEHSATDDLPGKRMWSCPDPLRPDDAGDGASVRGRVRTVDGVEELTVGIGVEPFDNGATVSLRLRFRADRPHQVGIAAFRLPGSAELEHCVLSATMGNWARLRRLELADGVVTPADLWPDFGGDHFTPHGRFGLDRLTRTPEGDAVVSAVPDEPDPASAVHDPATKDHWRYSGVVGRQTWRVADPDPELAVQVNGRHVYWMSTAAIPGGTAYENLELVEPFRDGREFVFSVDPVSPASP